VLGPLLFYEALTTVFLKATVLGILLSYIGLAISLWPNVVPPNISIWQAASAPSSQAFMLVGALLVVPVMLGYIAYSYWVFRGKVRDDSGYH
jgi:cytochrome d ubiquinol oxidase subunit II